MRNLPLLLSAVLIPTFTHAKDLSISEVHKSVQPRQKVTVKGTITGIAPYFAQIHDGSTGIKIFYAYSAPDYQVGDEVKVSGKVELLQGLPGEKYIRYDKLEKIGSNHDLCQPIAIAAKDLQTTSGLDFRQVSISGIVAHAYQDEFDPNYVFLCFAPVGCRAIAAVNDPDHVLGSPENLIDAEVAVTGLFSRQSTSRHYFGPHVVAFSPSAVQVVKSSSGNPFDAPEHSEDAFSPVDPSAIAPGHRQRVSGTVVASWNGNSIFLQRDNGTRLRVHLDPNSCPPSPGDTVTISGFPSHTMFFPQFVNAICRIDRSEREIDDETPQDVTPHDLLANDQSQRKLHLEMDGRLLRLRGTVILVSETEAGRHTIHMSSRGQTIRVEAGILPTPSVGAEIEATGICLFVEDASSAATDSPRIGGFSLLLRRADDIRILKNPPWLTPLRTGVILGSLLLLLTLGVVWNILLQKLVARRGRQLARESLAHLKAELRIDERTRLAVELHDSLSQNLSGLACQITAVKKSLPDDATAAAGKLDIAERMLFSSRTELKRCLWDLRGNTLECRSMTEAVRQTVLPAIGDAALFVRFDVSRARLTDTTAHSILCIVRELAANAVRHGRATRIKIAGTVDGPNLVFSVRDNGTGFDITHHAGIAEGHFGLEGIRERVERLNGDFRLESSPETGTSARIMIPKEQSI